MGRKQPNLSVIKNPDADKVVRIPVYQYSKIINVYKFLLFMSVFFNILLVLTLVKGK